MSMLSSLDPALDGLEQLRALLASATQPPIHQLLDIALIAAEAGFVQVEAKPGEQHLNPAGIVQGGYIAAVLDTACGCAVHSALASRTAFSTLELKVAFHRAITSRTGLIRAEGRLLSIGRRAAFSEAKLFDSSGKLLASATSSLILTPLEK